MGTGRVEQIFPSEHKQSPVDTELAAARRPDVVAAAVLASHWLLPAAARQSVDNLPLPRSLPAEYHLLLFDSCSFRYDSRVGCCSYPFGAIAEWKRKDANSISDSSFFAAGSEGPNPNLFDNIDFQRGANWSQRSAYFRTTGNAANTPIEMAIWLKCVSSILSPCVQAHVCKFEKSNWHNSRGSRCGLNFLDL